MLLIHWKATIDSKPTAVSKGKKRLIKGKVIERIPKPVREVH